MENVEGKVPRAEGGGQSASCWLKLTILLGRVIPDFQKRLAAHLHGHDCQKQILTKILLRHTLCAMLLALGCAKEGYPPGGPADTTPPRILQVSPRQDSTRVGRDTQLVFAFSEKIDRKSFENAIFISPSPGASGDFRFKWRGNRVQVILPDSLRAQRTYVVTIGSEVRDLRSNRMPGSFSFAFSTGDSVDRGEIAGLVSADKPAGVLMLAYILENGDHPDPAKKPADYYTQTGQSGEFKLSYLAAGRYRIFAVTDRDGDRLYTRGEEMIGIPTRDVEPTLNAMQSSQPLVFRLAAEDTLPPALSAVTAASVNQVEWRFEEAVAPKDSLWKKRLHLRSTAGDSVRILLAAPHPLEAGKIYSITTPLQSLSYNAFVDSLFDQAGNPMDTAASSVELAEATQPDTLRPRLVRLAIPDSSRNVLLEAPFDLIFSEIMKIDSVSGALLVLDSTGAPVAGKNSWVNPFQFRFQPEPRWNSRARYLVKIQPEGLRDWNGNTLFDTTGQVSFWTVNADTFASISGKITDSDSNATGTIGLAARQIGSTVTYRAKLHAPGAYRFQNVLPGQYLITGYRDANDNGRFDFGSALPFVPAERFAAWPDTIRVRSRWPNEGNDFEFP